MATYQPKLEGLRTMAGIWQVEDAAMDHVDEAYYLGGDFEGRRERIYYYMVWGDPQLGRCFAGFNAYGQREVPFSKDRCEMIGIYKSLRDALAACEDHAWQRFRRSANVTVQAPLDAFTAPACAFSGPVYF